MKKFTVIITHYNQMRYIEESLISVLKQNYRNIELIVADDCSKLFNKKKVEKIINKYNKSSFDYKILVGEKNQGTVKNLNNAVRNATGDYILFFAADDKLYDENVISNFVKEFEDKEKKVVTTQCLLYDEFLKKKISNYVNPIKAHFINKKSSFKIYEKMAEGCFYGSGGTAYRKEVFKKYGFFDENYPFVEDWSYWLKILREGTKMYYANFKTLCHRDGGISHSQYTPDTLPKHVKQYYCDIINIYKNEVFPYMDKFNMFEKYRILVQFQETTMYYGMFVPKLNEELNFINIERSKDKKFNIFWKIMKVFRNFKTFIIKRIQILLKYNITIPITFVVWFLTMLLVVNNIKMEKNIMLIIYVASYFAIYTVVNLIVNCIKYFKNYKSGGLNV